jgi:cobalt-zinc-cadmium efflux system membrane fusion protein
LKFTRLIATALLCAAPLAWSHDGEDHGAPPPTVNQAVAPRASAKSEDFELLAVLDGKALVIYLDAFASNAPVPGAKVEVDGGGLKGVAAEQSPGVYSLPAPALGPGKHALTISIETADNADLLATTLEVAPEVAALAKSDTGRPWLKWAGGGALLLAAGLVLLSHRRDQKASAA